MASLLAVDLGVRTGLAFYGLDGRLQAYRSRNFGSASRLRRAVPSLLDEHAELDVVVLEGGGPLATIWAHEGARRQLKVRRIGAEEWRERFFYPRQRQNRDQAKLSARELARRVIAWSAAPKPTSLRHDAAEAILIGLWGVIEEGWLSDLPRELLH